MKKEITTLNLELLKQGKSLSWLSLKTKISLDKLKKIQNGTKTTISFKDLKKLIKNSNLKSLEELLIEKEVEIVSE